MSENAIKKLCRQMAVAIVRDQLLQYIFATNKASEFSLCEGAPGGHLQEFDPHNRWEETCSLQSRFKTT